MGENNFPNFPNLDKIKITRKSVDTNSCECYNVTKREVACVKPNEIVKEIMKLRGYSNLSLATKLGKSTASAVSNPLSREKGMRIDTLVDMVEAMDCEVIVRSTLKDKTEWKLKYNDGK